MEFILSITSSPFGAMAALLATFVVGEVLSKLTNGIIPQALGTTVMLLAGFWTGIFPSDIVTTAGGTPNLFNVVAALLVANMASLISINQMKSQWKTVVIAFMCGIVAITVACMTLGSVLFGVSDAAAACGPIAGGAIAAAMVREQATNVGNLQALTLCLTVYALESISGYPLVSLALRKESTRLAKKFRAGESLADNNVAVVEKTYKIDSKEESANLTLLKLCLIVVVAMFLGKISIGGFSISLFVWALILGFVAHEVGFIQTDGLSKANCFGLGMTILMLYLFGGVSSTTPEMFLGALGKGLVFIVITTLGMVVFSFIASKIFKKSFWMCFAIALNCNMGFPINVVLTNEALDLTTEGAEERAAVSAEIMPQMLVGGFTSITVVSVILAGFLVNYIV